MPAQCRETEATLFHRECHATLRVDRYPDGGAQRPARHGLIAGRANEQAVPPARTTLDLKIDVAAVIDLCHDAAGDRARLSRGHDMKVLRPYEQIDRCGGARA